MDKKIVISSLACSLILGAGTLQSEEEVLHYAPLGAATEVRAELVAKKAYADDEDQNSDQQQQQQKKKNKDKEGKCKEGKCKESDCGGNKQKDKEGKCKQGTCS